MTLKKIIEKLMHMLMFYTARQICFGYVKIINTNLFESFCIVLGGSIVDLGVYNCSPWVVRGCSPVVVGCSPVVVGVFTSGSRSYRWCATVVVK